MDKRFGTSCVVVMVGFLMGVCQPVLAHHGSAAYSDRVIVLKEATVTKFQWGNPHSIVMFDVKDDKGNVTHWAAEAGSPSALSAHRLEQEFDKPRGHDDHLLISSQVRSTGRAFE